MKVHGIEMPEDRLMAALLGMKGFFRSRDVEAVVAETLGRDFHFRNQHRGSTIMRAADRLIQRARKNGKISFAGGYWQVARDSDGSREASETGTGSTEGNSAGPQGIAQTPDLSSEPSS